MRIESMTERPDDGPGDGKPQAPPAPYSTTPVFDESSLPAALRNKHCTKAGAWGVIRVLEGELRLVILDPPSESILTPDLPGRLLPEQVHFVEPLGGMKMQIEFYHQRPEI
jgi:tellurite resistance-related uncharacterized protein